MNSNDITLAVLRAIEQLGLPYMLVGSYSSNMYGVPRATQDADFVVQMGDTPISEVCRLLGEDFRLDPQMSFESVTGTMRYILSHRFSSFKVELFLLSNDLHDQQRFARRRQAAFLGKAVSVPTAEDVIITKLRWSKGGARRKDVDDVENVLAVQGDALDLAYIRQWCDRHSTREMFEKLLSASKS